VTWQTVSPQGGTTAPTTYAISIRVVSGTLPVPAVVVTLAELVRITDAQGYVTFSASAGTHNLKVVQEGATVYTTQFQVDADGVWQIDLDQPDQPPINITPEEASQPYVFTPEIAQVGIVIIVIVLLAAFFWSQLGKGATMRKWRSRFKNLTKGRRW